VVVVLALALAGFLLVIRSTHADHGLLGNLVIRRISISVLPSRPAYASSIPASDSPFKIIKDAAKKDPNRTGLYEKEWVTPSDKTGNLEAGVLVQLLPDSKTAGEVFTKSKKQFVTSPSLTGQTVSVGIPFSIPSVPGAFAEWHAMTSSSTNKSDGYAYTAVFQMNRVVVGEVLAFPTLRPLSDTTKIAEAEYALLVRGEPGFSMLRTTFPVLASVIWWVVAALVAAATFFVPEWAPGMLQRRHASHVAKELDRARSQYRARGRRAVRRHRAPAWRQPGRR
jgi:hypothetical protein